MNYTLTNRPDLVHMNTDDGHVIVVIDASGYPDYQARWDEYQQWLAAGNTPLPAPEPPAPAAPPTAAEKLAAAGLTVDELKALLST